MKEDGVYRPLFTNCLTIEKSFDMITKIRICPSRCRRDSR